MSAIIDYYLAPQSPWTYLGHERFAQIAKSSGAQVRVRPVNLGKVFPVFGGVQLKDRHPQRKAYRLVELARFRDYLKVPLHLEPTFFPVDALLASRLIVAAQQAHGEEIAFKLAGALMAAVWAQQRNIADQEELKVILGECGLPETLLEQADSETVHAIYDQYTQEAIDIGVFGAPSYVLDGEIFWGQDRLMFLEQALEAK